MNAPVVKDANVLQNLKGLYNYVIAMLEKDLSPHLTYHDVNHTREVVAAVEELSDAEHLSVEEHLLVYTAALFHDTGFLNSPDNHEEESCRLASLHLPAYLYTPEQVNEICDIIMATKAGAKPQGKLQEILCDADLYYLGTSSYAERCDKLYSELKYYKQLNNKKQWLHKQFNFLLAHKYYTQTAIQKLNDGKKKNIENVHLANRKVIQSMGTVALYNNLRDFLLIALGVISAGFALKGFLVPNHFFDGGVTGISLLLHEVYNWNLAYVIILANLPFIIAGYFIVSKKFAFKTFFAVVLLGLCLLFINYPIVTSDKLLISIFGGFFLGLGAGLVMRAGCSIDGIEVLALFTLKRTSFTISEIILGINVMIFIIAAIYLNLETALYSILTYFAASRAIDYVVEGLEAYTGVTIISGESEILKYRLVNELGKGITVYKGERGFLPGKFEIKTECDIIFTVVTRLELRRLEKMVHETDPNAFVFASTIKEAHGGVVKQLHSY